MSYPGGKNGAGVYQKIINLMPPHDVYIEPFLGGGAVMRHKRPARMNIGVDLDQDIIRGWQSRGSVGDRIVKIDDAGSGGTPEFQYVCSDGIALLRDYAFTGSELVYCDPTYLLNTRRGGQLYRHEMTDSQHVRLLQALKTLPCPVLISGYESALYAEHLADWNFITFEAMTRGGFTATEWLWFNFPQPLELHDYRYLGQDFRERERIKRKKQRWVSRLSKMGPLERQALLSAIGETFQNHASSSFLTIAAVNAENGDAAE